MKMAMNSRETVENYTLKRLGTALVILIAAGVCGRLGLWQLTRLAERRARNAEIEARMRLPPVPLESITHADSFAYRRVVGRGVFDLGRQAIEVGKPRRGIPGLFIVSPLVLPDGRASRVERGWVASPDARSVDLASFVETDSSEITGLLLHPVDGSIEPREGWPLVVRYADPITLQPRYPYPLLPWVLRRAELPPSLSRLGLEPAPSPELSEGSHLSYAIQWFSFGLIAIVGGVAAAWRTGRRRSPRVEATEIRY